VFTISDVQYAALNENNTHNAWSTDNHSATFISKYQYILPVSQKPKSLSTTLQHITIYDHIDPQTVASHTAIEEKNIHPQ